MMSLFRDREAGAGRALLVVALVVAALFGARGITDEGAVSTHGDMPRHVMNGVFLYDFAADGFATTPSEALDYAQRYFVQYPALSIGHHPPLLSIALVPFYAVFGVSVFSARLAIVVFFLLAVWFLYLIARRLYGPTAAGWAALLLASSPAIVRYGQEVMSEMPSVTMVLGAMVLLFRFTETGRRRDFVFFATAAVASLGAKQLAVFMFPVYAFILATGGRWRQLMRREILVMLAAAAGVVGCVAVATFVYSPLNAWGVVELLATFDGFAVARRALRIIMRNHFTAGLAVAALAGVALSIMQRDRRILLSLTWVVVVVSAVALLVGAYEPVRYAVTAVPAYCLAAASLAAVANGRRARIAATAILMAACAAQVWASAGVRPRGARGYEEAARFVVEQGGSPTVLYSAPVDTGFFVFFMRKHDAARETVVIRADKVLTTSRMGDMSLEQRIRHPDDIYPILDRFGTRFIVIEDADSGATAIEWLRRELKTDRFLERRRVPIVSGDPRLMGVSLAVYEYLDARAPDRDAEIDIRIPIVGREIQLKLSDVLDPSGSGSKD